MSNLAEPNNRLYRLMLDFAHKFELPHKSEGPNQVKIGIPSENQIITCLYNFDPSGDSYEFGAAVAKVAESNIAELATHIMQSTPPPPRGLSERIMKDKLVIFGSKDLLSELSDEAVISSFMDDIARIDIYFRQVADFPKAVE